MAVVNDVLNAQQAAALLGAHVETIRRMARKGSIPAFKVGKDWRFRQASLLAWSETNPGVRKSVSILVIDDEASVRKLIRRYLEPKGYRVITASTGTEGLAHLQNGAIQLVLLDLFMPVMTGPEFIRKLKEHDKRIPVIIVTGRPDSDMMAAANRFGPLMLIAKPIVKESLHQAVQMALRGSLAEHEAG